jgi:hypothetical protein
MGMNGINLIPAPRRLAKHRRAHLRYCAAGCVAWAALSLGAAVVAHVVWRAEDPEAAVRLAKVTEETQRTERVIAGLRQQLTVAQSTLRGNQAIVLQPDWSILLGLLGQQVGNDIVLKTCNVRQSAARAPAARVAPRPGAPRAGEAASGGAVEPPPFVLEASGMALDHASANQFVLRLEQTGLFSKVSLLDTAREPFFDKNLIAFRLECTLNQSPPGANGSAAAPGSSAAASARGGE